MATKNSLNDFEITIEQEINNQLRKEPHVLLLGAGASYAALPNGDKNGKTIPLLREVARNLDLIKYFPNELKDLSIENFESAYSKLHDKNDLKNLNLINKKINDYFSTLELPDEPNLYDTINLSLRKKDVIATFNWDPFLMQSRIRLTKLGITQNFPRLIFLHGNVAVGYCEKDKIAGLNNKHCSKCGKIFKPSQLLYPVLNKNYQENPFIKSQWDEIQFFLKRCYMFTVFGYGAPKTDIEAVTLLKKGWGDSGLRNMEQTEIVNKKGSDHELLEKKWKPFIHSHHFNIFDSFYDSFIANHPRRSIEAYWNQYWEAKFISNNSVPKKFENFKQLKEWFQPLIDAENRSS